MGVPGTLAATVKALERWGTISLSDAVAPAVLQARRGFPMYEHLYDKISTSASRLSRWNASRDLFLSADDSTHPKVPIGETFRNSDLGDTLELLGLVRAFLRELSLATCLCCEMVLLFELVGRWVVGTFKLRRSIRTSSSARRFRSNSAPRPDAIAARVSTTSAWAFFSSRRKASCSCSSMLSTFSRSAITEARRSSDDIAACFASTNLQSRSQ